MKIKFKRRQRNRIRKFLSGFHGKERTDLYRVFTAIAYLVHTGCQWKMLPRYYPPPGTVYYHFRKWSESTNLVFFLRRLVGGTVAARWGDGCVVECVKSNFGTAEFRPLSGRWVVERTNSWLENYRRLCRNYERYLSSARAMTYLAAILFMLRLC